MMDNIIHPRKALNKAFLKVKPNRDNINRFKANLRILLEQIKETEREEFHKNLLTDFLKKTYYSPDYFINTKDRNDLVIHNQKDSESSVGVILEVKKPTNKTEMVKVEQLNTKALQELVFYFLQERVIYKNLELKYLIVTNLYEWFIFDAVLFEKVFIENKSLVKQFNDFKEGRLSGKSTDFFYKEIAKPFLDTVQSELNFTYLNLRDYEDIIKRNNPKDDENLVALFKLFSPQHLLKLPYTNDSNTLDKNFYNELLHLIGLTETKEGNKKLITRKPDSQRHPGSLLENTLRQLDSLDKISRLENPAQFGETLEEQSFNIALELVITWVNRILFLKLLESQLMSYHQGDKNLSFLQRDKLGNFADLERLFFQVLAVKTQERNPEIRDIFAHVPYLNSALFEPTELEHQTLVISNLREEKLPIFPGTVLKDNQGNKRGGELNTLEYLFKFLDAYDFSSEGSEGIQEEQKTLINASVLGLIFEKINGYKDGSYFTPGFITMYMCRETLRKAVVEKFNQVKGWSCQNVDDLYDKIEDRREANQIINSLKICDPAVGSGHFLVSALNEIIGIKNDIRILEDRQGRRLKEYQIRVENDELMVIDEEGKLFQYRPKNLEIQRVQETLFQEKQTIIENCLFGVDINPNSVKICRLRLWIELLKNAYYKEESNYTELETLPNIDINIKCGNSLISRFALDADLKPGLRKTKLDIETYKKAVQTYKNTDNKTEKREIERLISRIKSNFTTTLGEIDPKKTKLRKLEGDVYNLENQLSLFEETKTEQKAREKKITKLNNEIDKLKAEIEEIEGGRLYDNAFEWRFEFPEILDDNGNFIGFDVVIGNPPYIRQEEIKKQKPYLESHFQTYSGMADLYVFFVEKSFEILRDFGNFCYIMPNKWMQTGYGKELRIFLLENNLQILIDFGDLQVFEEATTYPCIINASKQEKGSNFIAATLKTLKYNHGFSAYLKTIYRSMRIEQLNDQSWVISSEIEENLLTKIKSKCISLTEYVDGEVHYGIKTGLTEAFIINDQEKEQILLKDPKSAKLLKPILRGRTIKKWYTEGDNLWLIGTFPALNIDIDDYPVVRDYLLIFGKNRLEQSGKKGSRKKTSGQWFETQDSIAYWKKFEKPKIMYQIFQVKPCFIYDEQGLYCNNSMWIIPKADKVLLAILNSKMGWWLISQYCTLIRGGYQLIWQYFGQILIPKITEDKTNPMILIVDKILTTKKLNPNADTTVLEKQIDQMVYQLYELTPEEIKIVEGKQENINEV